MTKEQYAEAIKQAALTAGKTAVMQFLVSKFAFIALPIINPIIGLLVGYVLDVAIKETELGLFFNYIDMRTGNQSNEFEAAALKNFEAQKAGNAEEKANAEKELIAKFNAFVRLTN